MVRLKQEEAQLLWQLAQLPPPPVAEPTWRQVIMWQIFRECDTRSGCPYGDSTPRPIPETCRECGLCHLCHA